MVTLPSPFVEAVMILTTRTLVRHMMAEQFVAEAVSWCND